MGTDGSRMDSPSRTPIFGAPAIKRSTLQRSRLFSLFPGADDERLILIDGPAGTGKTTAIIQWLRGVRLPAAAAVWVQLHHGDEDRLSFWVKVISAVQDSGFVPHDSALAQFSTDSLSETGLRGILTKLFASLTSPYLIVIDDYHHTNSPDIDADCLALISAVPQLRLVIASRTRSTLHSVLAAARVDIRAISSEQFSFTLEETDKLASKLGAADRDALRVHELSGGWPMATLAMLLEASEHSREPLRADTGRGRFIEEYVAAILEHATPSARLVLLQTSLAADFTLAVAVKASGFPAAAVRIMLKDFEQSGITTRHGSRSDHRFQHHPALREQLQQHALLELESHQLLPAVRAHADALEAVRPHEAFELLCGIGDFEAADQLFICHFSRLTTVFAASTLKTIRTIPSEEFRQCSGIIAGRFLIEFADPTVPIERFAQWLQAIRTVTAQRWNSGRPPRTAELGVLSGIERMMGNGRKAAQFAALLKPRLSETGTAELRKLSTALPLIHALVALTDLVNGEIEPARAHFMHCATIGAETAMPFEQLRGLNGQALVTAVSGDIRAAEALVTEVAQLTIPESWGEHFGGVNLRLARACIAVERFDTLAAHVEIDALATHDATMELWPYLAILTAWTTFTERGPRSAATQLRATLERHQRRPKPVRHVQLTLTAVLATWV